MPVTLAMLGGRRKATDSGKASKISAKKGAEAFMAGKPFGENPHHPLREPVLNHAWAMGWKGSKHLSDLENMNKQT